MRQTKRAFLRASLSLASVASANNLADQVYAEGLDAAGEFCCDFEEHNERSYSRRNITERLEKNCKQGFDA